MKKRKALITKSYKRKKRYFKIFHHIINRLFISVLCLDFKRVFYCACCLLSGTFLFSQNTAETKKVVSILKEIRIVQNNDEEKALNLLNEALVYEKKLPDSLLIKLYDTAGELYLFREIYDQALNYYHSELLLQKKIKSTDQYITLKNIGNVYYNVGKDSMAKKYWTEAIAGYKKYGFPKIYILYNNLAILEEKAENYDAVKKIYGDALPSSTKMNDHKGKIMAYQNLGIVSFKQKEFKEALNFFFHAKKIAAQFNEYDDLAGLFYNLGCVHYNFPVKNKDSAEYYMKQSFLLSKKYHYLAIKKSSSEALIQQYEDERKYERANFYLHHLAKLNEEELNRATDKQISRVEFKYKQMLKQEVLISDQKTKKWIYFISFFILIAGCIILFLIYKLQKIKLIKTGLENELLLKKLDERNREITKKSIEVLHTNEILDVTKRKLTDLKEMSGSKPQITSILNEIKTSQKVLNLEEFEKIFTDTHKDFYKKLIELYPHLSRTDLKLSAFLRLNLSTKDISAITGQSQNSINIARHRLRKKLKLKEDENIINYLIRM